MGGQGRKPIIPLFSPKRYRRCQEPDFPTEERLPFVQPLSLASLDSSPSRGASGEEEKFSALPKPPLGRSNGDDRRQWRKQGGAVGAAASRMRAAAKQTLGAATRAVSPKVTERASPARKSRRRSDRQALCQSDTIAAPVILGQQPCPLSLAPLASSPKGGAFN